MQEGNVFFDQGDYPKALTAYDKALAIDPEDAQQIWYNKGVALAGLGQTEEGMVAYEKP